MAVHSLILTLATLTALTFSAPAPTTEELDRRQILPTIDDDYVPKPITCPSGNLVRPATGLNPDEASYVSSRQKKASGGLAAWLSEQGNFSTSCQPTVGFTSSGGGYRALLQTAGVIQAFDARDSSEQTSGIYQGLTYQAGLSGGAWFLSSLSGNNWPTVSFLRDNLWDSFQFSLLLPANVLDVNQYPEVIADVAAKKLAGFDNTIVDPYGRLLSYQLLEGEDGGDDIRLSTLTSLSNFTSFNVPYPIITALGVDNAYQGQCFPTIDSTQWEFHPYEYGSWDAGVSAFATTQYMGSALTNGQPTNPNECIQHYDNIGYIFGTSSNIFVGTCAAIEPDSSNNASLPAFLSSIVSRTQRPTFQDKFGIYPNPFFQYPQSPLVQENTLLTLADGGLAGQNVPIWPFITGPRKVDILIASDNSADTSENFPNGTEIRQTYLNAQARNLTRMPYIPPVSEFTLKNLTNRAVFFGCESLSSSNEEEQQQQQETLLLIWLPNVAYTYPSNQPTSKIQYSQEETRGMIENGNAIATQNGDAEWPFCLACGIKARDAELPEECEACFEKYCYRRNGGGGIEGMRNN